MVAKGNSEALKAYESESQADTRLELEKALTRLRNGQPKRIHPNAKINASTLAKEAGVERSTIYRYHSGILNEVQRITHSAATTRLKEKHSAYAQAEAKTKEYRQMLEKCQADKEILKRENYRLQYRIDELELLLKQRDEMVDELQQKTNMTQTVKFLK
jgi:DNA-binding XRE family transcriptional regulator